MGQQTRYEDQDIDIDKEAMYLKNQWVSLIKSRDIRSIFFGNIVRNYTRDGQYDTPPNREQGN